MNPLKRVYYFIYLLQLENYDVKRFWDVAFSRALKPVPTMRSRVQWTSSMNIIVGLSILLVFLDALLAGTLLSPPGFTRTVIFLVVLLIDMYIFFVPLLIVVWFLRPFDEIRKKRTIARATEMMQKRSDVRVVAIAGSYGKTTMKEMMSAVLKEKYSVIASRGNENTAIGVARMILRELKPETEVAVIEMGEYILGDIAEICSIATPEVSIVTGINEAHLERMGNIENTIKTIFEVVTNAKPRALVLYNVDDENVSFHVKAYIGSNSAMSYGKDGVLGLGIKLLKNILDTETLRREITFKTSEENVSISSQIIAEYVVTNSGCAFALGNHFDVDFVSVAKALEKIPPVKHRLEPIQGVGGVLVIDDSYNGNPEGAREALDLLGEFEGRRKICLTPGLVELGSAFEEVHIRIGKHLASVVDIAVLIQTSASVFLKQGLLEARFPETSIVEFSSALEAHEGLKKIYQQGDVVLFLNDWPDNYE